MTSPGVWVVGLLVCGGASVLAQQATVASPRTITLGEAVDLALKRNHDVRLANLRVDEARHARAIARSGYFPVVSSAGSKMHVSNTQLIEVPAGAFGVSDGKPIPPGPIVINQGGETFGAIIGGLTQPITQLLKTRAANDMARAEADVARGLARETENDVALAVHELYYKVLIAEAERGAADARIRALSELQSERAALVRQGEALDSARIESQAQSLQARQELLNVEILLADLGMRFNEMIGLPLRTAVTLDPSVGEAQADCPRDECVELALQDVPTMAAARAAVAKAEAAVRLAQYQFVPDVEAFVRYSYQEHFPFLARNFATVGVEFRYELFDFGRRSATIRERRSQLAAAREQLARAQDDVELRVRTAQNKLERTREMIAVSAELLALREESRRVIAEQATRGAALRSQVQSAVAQEFQARAMLLQSRLDYVQAADEMSRAVGRLPGGRR
jgi:outer membrane protein TolC